MADAKEPRSAMHEREAELEKRNKQREQLALDLAKMRDKAANFPPPHDERFQPKHLYRYSETPLAKQMAEFFVGLEDEVKAVKNSHAIIDAFHELNLNMGKAYNGFIQNHPIDQAALDAAFRKLDDELKKAEESAPDFAKDQRAKLKALDGALDKELNDLKASLDKQRGVLFSAEQKEKAYKAYATGMELGIHDHLDLWIRDEHDPDLDKYREEEAKRLEGAATAVSAAMVAPDTKKWDELYKKKIERLTGQTGGYWSKPGSDFKFHREGNKFTLADVRGVSADSRGWLGKLVALSNIGGDEGLARARGIPNYKKAQAWNELFDLVRVASGGSRSIEFSMPIGIDRWKFEKTYKEDFKIFLAVAEARNQEVGSQRHVWIDPDSEVIQDILKKVSVTEREGYIKQIQGINKNYMLREEESEDELRSKRGAKMEAIDAEIAVDVLNDRIKELKEHEAKRTLPADIKTLLGLPTDPVDFKGEELKKLEAELKVLDERLAKAVRANDAFVSYGGAKYPELKRIEDEHKAAGSPPPPPPEIEVKAKLDALKVEADAEVKAVKDRQAMIKGVVDGIVSPREDKALAYNEARECQRLALEGKPFPPPTAGLSAGARASVDGYREALSKAPPGGVKDVAIPPGIDIPAGDPLRSYADARRMGRPDPLAGVRESVDKIGVRASNLEANLAEERDRRLGISGVSAAPRAR